MEKTVSDPQGGDVMSDAELRCSIATILMSQATILRLLSGFERPDKAKKILDYAKELDNFSNALMIDMEEDE